MRRGGAAACRRRAAGRRPAAAGRCRPSTPDGAGRRRRADGRPSRASRRPSTRPTCAPRLPRRRTHHDERARRGRLRVDELVDAAAGGRGRRAARPTWSPRSPSRPACAAGRRSCSPARARSGAGWRASCSRASPLFRDVDRALRRAAPRITWLVAARRARPSTRMSRVSTRPRSPSRHSSPSQVGLAARVARLGHHARRASSATASARSPPPTCRARSAWRRPCGDRRAGRGSMQERHRQRRDGVGGAAGRRLAEPVVARFGDGCRDRRPQRTRRPPSSPATPPAVAEAGRRAAATARRRRCAARGHYAFHSRQMDTVRPSSAASLDGSHAVADHRGLVSTVTGEVVDGTALDAAYWAAQRGRAGALRRRDRGARPTGCDMFIELGPHPVLGGAIVETVGCPPALSPWWPRRCAEAGRTSSRCCSALGRLHFAGRRVDWTAVQPGRHRVVDLPTYPWQRQRHWDDVAGRGAGRGGWPAADDPLPSAAACVSAAIDGALFEIELTPDAPSFLADHRIGELVVVPAPASSKLAAGGVRRGDRPAGTRHSPTSRSSRALAVATTASRTIVQVHVRGDASRSTFAIAALTRRRHLDRARRGRRCRRRRPASAPVIDLDADPRRARPGHLGRRPLRGLGRARHATSVPRSAASTACRSATTTALADRRPGRAAGHRRRYRSTRRCSTPPSTRCPRPLPAAGRRPFLPVAARRRCGSTGRRPASCGRTCSSTTMRRPHPHRRRRPSLDDDGDLASPSCAALRVVRTSRRRPSPGCVGRARRRAAVCCTSCDGSRLPPSEPVGSIARALAGRRRPRGSGRVARRRTPRRRGRLPDRRTRRRPRRGSSRRLR